MQHHRRYLVLSALAALGLLAGAPGSAFAQPSAQDRQARLTSAETFLPMPTMSAGIMRRSGTRGMITVDMGVDIQDGSLRERAHLNEPRIRDALRTALASYANTYYRVTTAPDPDMISRLMEQEVARALGRPGAQILLVNVVFQPRN